MLLQCLFPLWLLWHLRGDVAAPCVRRKWSSAAVLRTDPASPPPSGSRSTFLTMSSPPNILILSGSFATIRLEGFNVSAISWKKAAHSRMNGETFCTASALSLMSSAVPLRSSAFDPAGRPLLPACRSSSITFRRTSCVGWALGWRNIPLRLRHWERRRPSLPLPRNSGISGCAPLTSPVSQG